MRGEDLGNAWLYESDRQMPGGRHGYRYWDALDLMRQRSAEYGGPARQLIDRIPSPDLIVYTPISEVLSCVRI